MIKYGQADLMIFIMEKATEKLLKRGLLTAEEKRKLDKLNEETVLRDYPSVRDYELMA